MDNKMSGGMDTLNILTSDSQTVPRNLLTLPELVLYKVLDSCNFFTLKKLRLVSKAMKKLVEHPRYLEMFQIIVTDKNQEDLLFSTVEWNNFYIPNYPDNFEIPNVLKNYGRFIRHLVINENLKYSEFKMIFNALGKDSNIETLVCSTYSEFNPDHDTYDDSKNWNTIFKNLKSLWFGELHENMNCDSENTFLFNLLINCVNLTYLEIQPTFEVAENNGNSHTPSEVYKYEDILIFKCLLKYFEWIRDSSKRSNLIINFTYGTAHDKNIVRDIFFLLAKVASEIGVQFSNVPVYLLQNYNLSLTSVKKNIYDKSLISVKAYESSELKDIYIPCTSKIFTDFDGFYESDVLPCYPIHNLHVVKYHLSDFVEIFVAHGTRPRPTVKELQIIIVKQFHEENHEAEPINLSSLYPNLRKLGLCGKFTPRLSFYNSLFLNGLENLNHLIINSSCDDGLNDARLLGEDINNPHIRQLSNLTHLELDCSRLTNLSFVNAFRFMKLKTFEFSNCLLMENYDEAVTFQDGISALATVEGGFQDSIEVFRIILPSDSTMSNINEFMNKFKNLRKETIYEKKKPLKLDWCYSKRPV